MNSREELQELLTTIAFPDTPEERDEAERAVHHMLSEVRQEGFNQGKEECCGMGADPNPYAAPEISCPTRYMDGRNEIRCWYSAGHEGDCR